MSKLSSCGKLNQNLYRRVCNRRRRADWRSGVDGLPQDAWRATIHRCPIRVEPRIADQVGGALGHWPTDAGIRTSVRLRHHRHASPDNAGRRLAPSRCCVEADRHPRSNDPERLSTPSTLTPFGQAGQPGQAGHGPGVSDRRTDRRLSEDVAADRKEGALPIDITPHVLRHSFASYTSRQSPACSGTRRTASPADTSIPLMPRCWPQQMTIPVRAVLAALASGSPCAL